MIHFLEQNQLKDTRKFIAITVVLLLLIGGLVYFFFSKGSANLLKNKGIDAVPTHATAIVQFTNDPLFYSTITKNIFFENLLGDSLITQLGFVKTLFTERTTVGAALNNSTFTLSAHQTTANTLDFLLIATLPEPGKWKNAEAVFAQLLSVKNTLSKRKFENETIYELSFFEKKRNVQFAIQNNLLIVSTSPFLVEEAIRQLHSGKAIMSSDLLDYTENNQLAEVYLHYTTLVNSIYPVLKNDYKNGLNFIKNAGSWSRFTIAIQSDAVLLNGFTETPTNNQFFSTITNQQPVATEITDVLPNRSAAFVCIGISDYAEFCKKNNIFLLQNNQLTKKTATSIYTTRRYAINLEQEFAQWVGTELAWVLTETNGDSAVNNQLAFVKTEYPEKATAFFQILTGTDSIKTPKIKFTEYYRNNVLYTVNIPGIWAYLGGPLFGKMPAGYAAVIKNHVVVAAKKEELKKYIDDYLSLQTLYHNEQFKQTKAYYAKESNLMVFANSERNFQLVKNTTSISESALNKHQPVDFGKLYGMCYQISNNNNRLFTNIVFKYNSATTSQTRLLWSLGLDHPIRMQPQVVINHNSREKEIVVQDEKNVLYLLSNTGKVIWKKPLPERIISAIYQVDFYKNDKLQLLFNSANKLYLIDRLGNMVAGYPIRLSAPASAGLAVFDYDNDKSYRIFIPCQNEAVYGYQLSGKPLDGWSPKKRMGKITQPIQYLRIEGKDYLVMSNTKGTVNILNRKARKIKDLESDDKGIFMNPFVADEITKAGETQFVTTNTNGTIHRYFLNGDVDTRKVGNWSESHFFNYKNISNGKENEYVFLDKNTLAVYSKKNNALVFSYEFPNDITLAPQFIDTDSNYHVGIVSAAANQIFGFNSDGNLLRGFPINGSTPFSVTNFRNDGKKYLIVGSSDKNVYVYSLE